MNVGNWKKVAQDKTGGRQPLSKPEPYMGRSVL